MRSASPTHQRGVNSFTLRIRTFAVMFAASNVIKIPGFATLGFLTHENLVAGLALVPIAIAANYAGIWLVRRTSNEMFYRIAYALMVLIAAELIVHSRIRPAVRRFVKAETEP